MRDNVCTVFHLRNHVSTVHYVIVKFRRYLIAIYGDGISVPNKDCTIHVKLFKKWKRI